MGVALAGARRLTAVVFGVSPTDPRTLTTLSLLLVALAGLACLVPGRRAAKLDPAAILRES